MARGLPLLLLAEVSLELPLDFRVYELQERLLVQPVVEVVAILAARVVPRPPLPLVRAHVVDVLLKVARVVVLVPCQEPVCLSLHVDLYPPLILHR